MTDTLEDLVDRIRTQYPAIPRAAAERAAKLELAGTLHAAGVTLERVAEDADEDAHVNAGRKLVRSLGGHYAHNSQKRRSKVEPGISDSLIFFPRHRRFAFWEAKRIGGKQSSAQKLFQELCEGCGLDYVLGPIEALETWIIAKAIAKKESDGSWTLLPFHPLIDG